MVDNTDENHRAGQPPVLQVRSLSKAFGAERALDAVDLDLAAGEVRGLVGANGSGKSTLVKILAGFHHADDGSPPVLIDGEPVNPAADQGIDGFRFIHQDLALVLDLTVAENIALHRAQTGLLRPLRMRAEAREIAAQLRAWDLDFGPHTLVQNLSAIERTMVAVARAFRRSASPMRVLVLDEVTATLPPDESRLLFERIGRLDGISVLFVSHRIEEVLSHCRSVTVLRDGRVVADRPTEGLSAHDLVMAITGREPEELFPSLSDPGRKPVLTVRGLTGAGIHDLDLDVHAGEIVGLASLDPHEGGRVLRMLCGDIRRAAGEVAVDGVAIGADAGPADTNALGVSLVADRLEGGIPAFTVRENLTLNGLGEFAGRLLGTVSTSAERRGARELIERYQVTPRTTDATLASLSGGNQQKVIFAKSMRLGPKLLLLDDPTRGIDIGARAVLYRIIREAAEDGLGVLVTSTEFSEIAGLCHRAIVLTDGRAGSVVEGDRLAPDLLLERCYMARAAA
jgi:ribose transport system ATP-binding protein